MQDSILRKLEALVERHQEVEQLLSQPDVIADQDKFRELNREYSQLQVTVTTYKQYTTASDDLVEMEQMLKSDDPDEVEMAQEEIEPTREKVEKLSQGIAILLGCSDSLEGGLYFEDGKPAKWGYDVEVLSGLATFTDGKSQVVRNACTGLLAA